MFKILLLISVLNPLGQVEYTTVELLPPEVRDCKAYSDVMDEAFKIRFPNHVMKVRCKRVFDPTLVVL